MWMPGAPVLQRSRSPPASGREEVAKSCAWVEARQLLRPCFGLVRQPAGLGSFGHLSASLLATTTALLSLLDTGASNPSFGTTANPSYNVKALLALSNDAFIAGDLLTTIGGQPAVGLARISAPNVLATMGSATRAIYRPAASRHGIGIGKTQETRLVKKPRWRVLAELSNRFV